MVEPYLERLLIVFVENADDKDFVILSHPDDGDQFVQFMRRRGTIYAEVSSRQWGPVGTERPLSDSNEMRLMRLGFAHGNYPPSPGGARTSGLTRARSYSVAFCRPTASSR